MQHIKAALLYLRWLQHSVGYQPCMLVFVNVLRRRRRIHTLYVLSTLNLSARKDAGAIRAVLSAAESANIPVQEISRHELNLLSDYRQHQVGCWSQPPPITHVATSVVGVTQPG